VSETHFMQHDSGCVSCAALKQELADLRRAGEAARAEALPVLVRPCQLHGEHGADDPRCLGEPGADLSREARSPAWEVAGVTGRGRMIRVTLARPGRRPSSSDAVTGLRADVRSERGRALLGLRVGDLLDDLEALGSLSDVVPG